MTVETRRPIPCDNSPDVIAALTSTLPTASDKVLVLQRIWGIVHLDKSKVRPMMETTLPVLLQMRLSSPQVNYWLAAVLEAFTASTDFVIHAFPAKDAFLNMLVKLLRVPDPMDAFVLSKCSAANAIANLIQVGRAPTAESIAMASVAIVLPLCGLLYIKHESVQLASLRALWRLAYYCPSVRDEAGGHLAKVHVIQSNKDIMRIMQDLRS